MEEKKYLDYEGLQTYHTNLCNIIEDNEQITAAALDNLDDRLKDIETENPYSKLEIDDLLEPITDKLNDIEEFAEVNVQSDWNQTDTNADDYIKNKPLIGVANGIASLDSTGKVPSSQLPSYVDDVIEGYYHNNKFYATYTPGLEEQEGTYSDEIMPELGKIYIDIPTNQSYRWSGSTYIVISSPYVLPTASASTLGGIKVGDGLSIDNNGVLSAEVSLDVYTRAQVDVKVADTVHLSAQTLTEAQKAQARNNIGVVGSGFQVTTDETTGTDVFIALGTATITHDNTTGADVFSF